MSLQRTVAPAMLCLLFPILALAQKNEISLSMGAVTTSDQQLRFIPASCPFGITSCTATFNINTNTGLGLQGNYTRQIISFGAVSIGAEFPLVGIPSRHQTTELVGAQTVTASASSLFFTPSARIKFLPSRSVSPFFSIGGGLVRSQAFNPIHGGALQFGGGVDFKTRFPHVDIRGEIRDFWARGFNDNSVEASPTRLHNVFAGGGIVFKF